MTTRKQQVKWTTEEILAIVKQLVRLRKECPYDNFLSLLEQAMKIALPDHSRHRVVNTMAAVRENLLPVFAVAWAAENTPPAPAEPALVFIERQVPIMDFSLVDPELIISEAAKIQYRLQRATVNKTERVVEETHTQMQIVITSSGRRFVSDDAPKKKHVLIVGLLNDQFAAVEKTCETEQWNITLSSLDTSHSAAAYKGHAEYVVFSKFTSHGHIDSVKARLTKNLGEDAKRRIYYMDGCSSVIQKCRDINSMR